MASPRAQEENRAEVARNNAASANSIPALRAEVVRLAEAVQILEKEIRKLIKQRAN